MTRPCFGLRPGEQSEHPIAPTTIPCYNAPMTADPPKKRRWFQVHLSTACALMLAGSGLVYINLLPLNPIINSPIKSDVKAASMSTVGRGNFDMQLYQGSITLRAIWARHEKLGCPFTWVSRKINCSKYLDWPITEYDQRPNPDDLNAYFKYTFSNPTKSYSKVSSHLIPKWFQQRAANQTLNPTKIKTLPWNWSVAGMFANIFISLAILAATGFACEWLIHRRERKREAGKGQCTDSRFTFHHGP